MSVSPDPSILQALLAAQARTRGSSSGCHKHKRHLQLRAVQDQRAGVLTRLDAAKRICKTTAPRQVLAALDQLLANYHMRFGKDEPLTQAQFDWLKKALARASDILRADDFATLRTLKLQVHDALHSRPTHIVYKTGRVLLREALKTRSYELLETWAEQPHYF